MRTYWVNKEKLTLLAAGLWLLVVSFRFQHQRPPAERVGPQTVGDVLRPARLEIRVEELGKSDETELKLYAFGPRPDPFNVLWAEDPVEPVKIQPGRPPLKTKPRKRKPRQRPRPRVVKPKPKPKPKVKPPGRKPDETPPKTARIPKPYEIPVTLVGWISIGEEMIVHLRDKNDGGLLQVREGDTLPELGLTIVHADRSAVIVENDKGDRFLLREIGPMDGEENAAGDADGKAPPSDKRKTPDGGTPRDRDESPRKEKRR